jgi:hypothetical protein
VQAETVENRSRALRHEIMLAHNLKHLAVSTTAKSSHQR